MFIVSIITVWIKVTKDSVNFYWSLHQKYSVDFLSHQLQILTRRWHFATHVLNFPRSRCQIKDEFIQIKLMITFSNESHRLRRFSNYQWYPSLTLSPVLFLNANHFKKFEFLFSQIFKHANLPFNSFSIVSKVDVISSNLSFIHFVSMLYS